MGCSFLTRRGFCLKGANCDFLHPLNSQLSAQEKRVPSFVPTHPFVPQHDVRQDISFPFLSPNPLICPPILALRCSRSYTSSHPHTCFYRRDSHLYVRTDKTPYPMSNDNNLYNTQSVVMTNPQPVVKFISTILEF